MIPKTITAFMACAALVGLLAPLARCEKDAAKPVRETDEPVVSVVRERDRPVRTGPHAENLGSFTLTAYCACSECCGKAVWDPLYGVTASGTTVQQGRTVAVDPEVIPLGSVLYINGDRYIAEDTGGAVQGNHVDIYFDSHEKALEFGVQEMDVWIWREDK